MATQRYELYNQDGILIETHDEPIPIEQENEDLIRERAKVAIPRLTQIANTTGTQTAAQMSQAIRDEAKAIRALIRLMLGLYDSPD